MLGFLVVMLLAMRFALYAVKLLHLCLRLVLLKKSVDEFLFIFATD